jgi:hypothetical protein
VFAFFQWAKGFTALFFGEFPIAAEYIKRAEKMFVETCTGVTFYINNINAFLGYCLCHLGTWQELQQRWDACIKDAQEREDLYSLTMQRTFPQGTYRWLAVDRVDQAREQLSQGLTEWPWQDFDVLRFGAIYEASIEIYDGNYRQAFHIAQDISRRLFSSSYRLNQPLRVLDRFYLAHAALAYASVSPDRKPLLKIARQQANALAKENHSMAEPFVPYIKGTLTYLNGDEDSAVKLLAEAAQAFANAQFKLYAAATNRHLGRLLGGDEGRALIEKADETMREEGVVKPDRIAAMLAPGFPD